MFIDQPSSSWEWTIRRKRWQETLILELQGSVPFIISKSGKFLFCGRSIREVLGWKETELVDANIVDFLHENDITNFLWKLNESVEKRTVLDCVLRLRVKPPLNAPEQPIWKAIEIRARPHLSPSLDNCLCLVASARAAPSRYLEVYQSFLDLKLENERLKQRLLDPERPHVQPPSAQPPLAPHDGVPLFPSSSSSLANALRFDALTNFSATRPPPLPQYDPDRAEDLEEEVRKKRKTAKQLCCTTCGRTDSPEWRKGPLGPKTLCNACGLRWAKQKKDQVDGDVAYNI